MKVMTYEELMVVNGGMHTYSSGGGSGRRSSWWSRHRRTVSSHAKAAGKGFGYARAAVFIGRLVYALLNN